MSIPTAAADRYFGLFVVHPDPTGGRTLVRHARPPATIPCPTTGRSLRVATIEERARAICPACEVTGAGGFVSFEGDMRLAWACPSCEQVVWLPGA